MPPARRRRWWWGCDRWRPAGRPPAQTASSAQNRPRPYRQSTPHRRDSAPTTEARRGSCRGRAAGASVATARWTPCGTSLATSSIVSRDSHPRSTTALETSSLTSRTASSRIGPIVSSRLTAWRARLGASRSQRSARRRSSGSATVIWARATRERCLERLGRPGQPRRRGLTEAGLIPSTSASASPPAGGARSPPRARRSRSGPGRGCRDHAG